jgi:hypothetical protein
MGCIHLKYNYWILSGRTLHQGEKHNCYWPCPPSRLLPFLFCTHSWLWYLYCPLSFPLACTEHQVWPGSAEMQSFSHSCRRGHSWLLLRAGSGGFWAMGFSKIHRWPAGVPDGSQVQPQRRFHLRQEKCKLRPLFDILYGNKFKMD